MLWMFLLGIYAVVVGVMLRAAKRADFLTPEFAGVILFWPLAVAILMAATLFDKWRFRNSQFRF